MVGTQRLAARPGDSLADAAQRLHGAPGEPERVESSRSLAADGVFAQRLALAAGRLDLTNYFDHNAAANDERRSSSATRWSTTRRWACRATALASRTVFDPKNGFNFKFGFQQSNPEATNLSDSIYSLDGSWLRGTTVVLPEGNYRVWYRWDNTAGRSNRTASGISLDQKLIIPTLTLFGRVGSAGGRWRTTISSTAPACRFQNGWVFNPWIRGVSATRNRPARRASTRSWSEGYYNFRLTERLRLSFHLQHVVDTRGRGAAVRVSAAGRAAAGKLLADRRLVRRTSC